MTLQAISVIQMIPLLFTTVTTNSSGKESFEKLTFWITILKRIVNFFWPFSVFLRMDIFTSEILYQGAYTICLVDSAFLLLPTVTSRLISFKFWQLCPLLCQVRWTALEQYMYAHIHTNKMVSDLQLKMELQ